MHIHILSSSRKRPDIIFYGFHRRESRGPVAAGNHQKETTTQTIKKTFLATTETIKKPTTETITNVFLPRRNHQKNQRRKLDLKTPKTRNHSIRSKVLNPPATAESIEHLATETIQKRVPATTETIHEKTTTETIKNVSCHDGNHTQKNNDGNHKKCFLP